MLNKSLPFYASDTPINDGDNRVRVNAASAVVLVTAPRMVALSSVDRRVSDSLDER